MTTERELREWLRRKKRKRSNRFNLKISHLLAWFLVGAALVASRSHWVGPTFNSYITVPSSTILPPPLNPKAGVPSSLSLDYNRIDQAAKSIQYSGSSVTELGNLLSLSVQTEVEKARIIYTWIATNITYDAASYYSGAKLDTSPQAVLKSRTSICSGYANLFEALAKHMGLDARIVRGYAKGVRYTGEINHAWNAVKLDGAWYLVDSTWGAGNLNNNQFQPRFTGFYFATPPQKLIYTHLPQFEAWQLLESPQTKPQFENLPKLGARFFEANLDLVGVTNNSLGQKQIILKVPSTTAITAKLIHNGQELPRNYLDLQRSEQEIVVITLLQKVLPSSIELYAKKSDKPGVYPHVASFVN